MTVIKCDCCKKELGTMMLGIYILELGLYARPQDRRRFELCADCASTILSVLDNKEAGEDDLE